VKMCLEQTASKTGNVTVNILSKQLRALGCPFAKGLNDRG
jgi:hypothetical protein